MRRNRGMFRLAPLGADGLFNLMLSTISIKSFPSWRVSAVDRTLNFLSPRDTHEAHLNAPNMCRLGVFLNLFHSRSSVTWLHHARN